MAMPCAWDEKGYRCVYNYLYIYIYEAGTFTYHVMCCVAVYTKASQIISNFSTSLDLSCCLPRYVRSRYGASVSIFVDPA